MELRAETDGRASDGMLKDACRRKLDVVMAWAIERRTLKNTQCNVAGRSLIASVRDTG
jgi:hypothetical protein